MLQKFTTLKVKKNIAISDSGFLFNPLSGDSYSVNPSGLHIIRLLKEGKAQDEIIDLILKEFKTDKSTVEKDLYDFSILLETYKLTE